MSKQDDGCLGGIVLILILIIGGCVHSCDKYQNKHIKEDYSSPPSEMGEFTGSGGIGVRSFVVRNGVGYLTLNDGEVIRLKRVGNGRYEGLGYTATQTEYGYYLTRRGR
jgi:hypothetical protein